MDEAGLLRVMVVDDEELSRDMLRFRLEDVPDIEIIGECGDGDAAAESIARLRPDVIFMDIEMPGRSGLEVLEGSSDYQPAVIFVTAHSDYAVGAFEQSALDYLLKPVSPRRLVQALERAREHVLTREVADLHRRAAALGRTEEQRTAEGTGPTPSPDAPETTEPLRRIVVREDEDYLLIDLDRVWAFEAAGNYVRIRTENDRGYLVRGTLRSYERRLDQRSFARIHRSTIVSIDHIERITPEPHGDFVVTLDSGKRYRMSRSHRSRLLP